MRLRRLHLRNYGSFGDLALEFATEPGRVNLIVAPNGTGKSVLRRAFHDLLFDIPLQSPMKFRHGYPGMALHAEAIDADGTPFGFGWVRGAKPARVTTDPARYAALRQDVTPLQLERLFALDTRGLREGGTDLKGGRTLAEALLAGTGELGSAKAVRATIEARRQANWGQGRSKPPLNAAASRLDAERKRARAAVQRPEAREREERDLAARIAEHAEARQALDDARAEARRLNRIALTRPHLRQLADAQAWLAENPGTPALPAGLDRQLADARGAVALAQAAHDEARRVLAQATEAAARIGRDPAGTGQAERLAHLPGALGEAEKTTQDIAARRAEHAARLDDVRAALRAIGAAVPVERAADIVPTLGLMADARAAITQEAGLRKALDFAVDRLARAARAREAIVEAAPAATLPDGLTALLDAVRADRGNPAQHAAELAEATRIATARVTRLLAVMPGWSGTADALRALAVPSEAQFARLDATRQDAATGDAKARAHQAALTLRGAEARQALDALRAHHLPDAGRIAAARAERDRGMRLVLRHAFGTPPSAAEDTGYAGAEPVALVYESQVRTADDLADQRTAELARVQEAERLARLLGDLAAPAAAAEAAVQEAGVNLRVAAGAWAEAVAPLGLNPAAALAELRQALAGRVQVIEAMGAEAVAAGAEAALRTVHADWTVRLANLLAAPGMQLGALLGHADDRVAAVRAAEKAAVKRTTMLEQAERDLRDAEEVRAQAGHGLAAWRGHWTALLGRLHRPGDETPDAVAAVLGGIEAVRQHDHDAVSLKRRIDAMQDDLDGFARTVAGLAGMLDEHPAATPAGTARLLIARAARAADAESAWRQAELGLDQARGAAGDHDRTLSHARATLAAVIAACGAATAEDAETRIAGSRAHAERVTQRDAARLALTEHGDGLPDTALRTDADAVAAEEMAPRRRAAEDAETGATARVQAAAIGVDQLRTTLAHDADATAAIDTRADYEAAVAEFGRRLEDQLVLNLASSLLGEAMRAVEEEMGGSSLARVSQAFAAVTGGAYRLETRDGAEGEELHAVEHAYPQERKSLDELSEGTRDQLYLALRMVALRDHCASATALPFIADDILQTFDEARAGATLRALGDLGADMQVIVLTHHAHLERVAAGLGHDRVHVLRL